MSGFLLDTHALLWLMIGDARITADLRTRLTVADELYVSAASAWEIRTKYRLGKLPEAGGFVGQLAEEVRRAGCRELPITFADGERAGGFAEAHKDPFDRMLAAQALNHRLALVSNDATLDAFGIVRVW